MDFGETITALAGIALGGLVVLIPLGTIALRFGIQPVLERWGQLRHSPETDQQVRYLEQRLSLVEQQVEHLERENGRLLEDAEFRMNLRSGIPTPAVTNR